MITRNLRREGRAGGNDIMSTNSKILLLLLVIIELGKPKPRIWQSDLDVDKLCGLGQVKLLVVE